jgi:hypothetical protein
MRMTEPNEQSPEAEKDPRSIIQFLLGADMGMKTEKIKVYGTKEGKLYIKPEDLFALPKVQEQIKRASNLLPRQNYNSL